MPPSRWIRHLALLLAFVSLGGLVRAVRGDTGSGSQHNDPGPAGCAHSHAGFNTSQCTGGSGGGDGASCTVNNKPGKCTTTRQQCYCVATTVIATDAGIILDAGVKGPIEIESFGFGGEDESGSR